MTHTPRICASNTLYHYPGQGLDFDQLLDLFIAQVDEELSPLLLPIDASSMSEEERQDTERLNADLLKSAQEMWVAYKRALEIYLNMDTEEEIWEALQGEGEIRWVQLIGEAAQSGDWSLVAI